MSGLLMLGAVAVACSGTDAASNGDGAGVIITPLIATNTPPAQPANPANGPTPGTANPSPVPSNGALRGFTWPIQGGCLPQGDQLMPNASRAYRNGTHEGVDFYDVDNCVSITRGTPVLAAKAGVVIRADTSYRDLTQDDLTGLAADPTSEESLDKYRGRQVWIDHGGGIVTRYAHLSSVAPGVTVGTTVPAGHVVAYVGESGTPESVTNPGREYHLHFEVRIGSGYLGKDQPAAEVRRLYQQLFAP